MPAIVEKIMSIKLSEFEAGLGRLDASAPATMDGGRYRIPNTDGVVITFEKLETAVLGGLMRLPRARVTIDVSALGEDARDQFVARFDQTFQRGGG